MLSTPTPPGAAASDAWDEIEGLIREVAEQARTDLPPAEFHAALLDRAIRGLAAAGGAVWVDGDGQKPTAQTQVRLVDVLPANGADVEQHLRLVAGAFHQPKARLIPPSSAGLDGAGNPTPFSVLLGPVVVSDRVAAVVEVFQRPGASPATQQGYLQFLAALCELGAEYQRNGELRTLREQAAIWKQFEEFSEHVHGSLRLHELAAVVANEGRRVLGCDRLSLASCRGRHCRLEAVSGLDSLDRRSNAVRRLEQLAQAVTAVAEPLWFEGDRSELPPQIESALERYLPESKARMVGVLPLLATYEASVPGRPAKRVPLGALIVENFDQSKAHDVLRQRATAVSRQVTTALRNATEVEAVPAYALWKALGRATLALRRRLPVSLLVLLGIAAVVAALWLIPMEFMVESFGELQPEVRRDIFAPEDGIVHELLVKPAQAVRKGDVLARLQSSKLDFEFSRVLGEKATAQQKLATVKAAQLKANDEADAHKLAAEEGELIVQLEALKEQQQILEDQRAELELRSPIDGIVLTWDPTRELASRPVQRGDKLLTVAKLDDQWQVEVQVPDHDIGHVLSAQREKSPDLPVSFLLASDPGVTYHGQVEKVASNAEIHETEGPCVKVTVRVTDAVKSAFRPGARVIPRIHCGPKPVGYVWLHDLIDAVRTRVLF